MAEGLLGVRSFGCSRLQNAKAENVVIMFSDTVTLDAHLVITRRVEHRITRRSVTHQFHVEQFVFILNDYVPDSIILICNSCFRIKVSSPIMDVSYR
jgi:hypothetical protein